MTRSARQMKSAWMGAGPMMLPPAAGMPLRNSSATKGGQVQPANLGQPGPPSAIRACPQARVDAPVGSTPVQSPHCPSGSIDMEIVSGSQWCS